MKYRKEGRGCVGGMEVMEEENAGEGEEDVVRWGERGGEEGRKRKRGKGEVEEEMKGGKGAEGGRGGVGGRGWG
ncbi:hypothetical protein NHX12_014561 [Muraenolepis orangiensis]|uniref:Uncharacterized protein n=1 Tax=Muraenolepis orangiensis TaxID=630683 RepID=A0A9Q0I3M6_9TELE|nr:hypothetical protein NHX12_014561 [Muraenolepis orangiensis]